MKAFLYGVELQFKMDIRSKTMLIICYLVPLVFFLSSENPAIVAGLERG